MNKKVYFRIKKKKTKKFSKFNFSFISNLKRENIIGKFTIK